jgi:hypothetical protein
MQLHQRGIDLLVDVQDAADHVDTLTRDEMLALLNEVSIVLGGLLVRDIPIVGPGCGQPDMTGWENLNRH